MPRRIDFPRVCIALGFDSVEKLLSCAEREAAEGATFFEFRLDYLKRPAAGVEAIRSLVAAHPECRILATCRRRENHGRFAGSVDEQIRLLEAAAAAGASAVDLEIESALPTVRKLAALRDAAALIISYHCFTGTPPLVTVVKRMQRVPAAAYKIVTTAKKPSDLGRTLLLPKAYPRMPLIVLSMGDVGFPSRVLAPIFGGLYSYAAPAEAAGTAPGQVSAHTLRQLYHIDSLTRSSKIYGVIADPVGHSLSPAIHNRAFHCLRVDAVYVPFQVPAARLRDFFEIARDLPLNGFSVTIPHKQKVTRYLDVVDPLARRIGAVNTVWRKGGKWRGANTDAAGVTAPLERRMRLGNASILVVGNGGAARAAAFALADKGAAVSITGRDSERVARLAGACGAVAIAPPDLAGKQFDAVVHATPLGMHPNRDECFFPDAIPGRVVFDMVYNPLETELLRRARSQGREVIPGLEMLIEQAVHQFEIWTGCEAPAAAMERAALEALAARSAPAGESGADRMTSNA